jgi:DMSO/TMAO reductase YedYZ molybdopterin-dependent catalytic subunit
VRPTLLAALAGAVAGALGLAVALAATLIRGPSGNPVTAVGSLLIDAAPAPARDAAIDLFGTADKPALIVLVLVVAAGLSALAGVVQRRRPPLGLVVAVLVAAAAVAAVLTRPGAEPLDAVPSLAGTFIAVLVLRILLQRLRDWAVDARVAEDAQRTERSRRGFLAWMGGSALVAVVAGAASQSGAVAGSAAATARAALRIPDPVDQVPVPAGADLDIEGLSPYVTANADFYRIDTALLVPQVDPREWRLRITGEVEQEVELGFDELLALPLVDRPVTLTCVSNEVGGDLVGTAVWRGYPLADLLARAGPRAGADMVLSTSTDGFTAGTPLDALTDPDRTALLAVAMNGQPLPIEHGFPARMVVAGLYGYVSATKWITRLEVTRFDAATAYWTTRGYSAQAPVKVSSRIDRPLHGARAGMVTVAGVAWAQHTGISRVQLQIDDGPWRDCELAGDWSVDVWRQWRYRWQAEGGSHTLRVRATDAKGLVQTAKVQGEIPNGATGLHTVQLAIS